MKYSESFTKVTHLSKSLAFILFVVLPCLGFYLGTYFQRLNTPPIQDTPTVKQVIKKENVTDKKLSEASLIQAFMQQTVGYTKSNNSVPFTCYGYSMPTNKAVDFIRNQLDQDNRSLHELCVRGEDFSQNVIVVSHIREPEKWNSAYRAKQEVKVYKFLDIENEKFSANYLLTGNESSIDIFKLNDWLSDDTIIFSLESSQLRRIKTYIYSLKKDIYFEPKLIEYCEYGVGGGTAQRYFKSCKSFIENKKSLYLKEENLP